MVAVVGLALVLMLIPAIVAGLAIGEPTLIQGARSWVQDASRWLAYLANARVFLFLPLAAMVVRVNEHE